MHPPVAHIHEPLCCQLLALVLLNKHCLFYIMCAELYLQLHKAVTKAIGLATDVK